MTLSRRRFLAGLGASGAAGVALPGFLPELAFASSGSADHTLVLVLLNGGLDGLSALVPAGDRAYSQRRHSTFVPGEAGFGVDRSFALHPALRPLADLWRDGLIAAVPAVGTVTQSRSHFAETAIVASGTDGRSVDGTGWLARHLLSRTGHAETLQAVSTSFTPVGEIVGHAGAYNVPDLDKAGLRGWDAQVQPLAEQALASAYAAAPSVVAAPATAAFEAIDRLRTAQSAVAAVEGGGDPWQRQARQVASLIGADIGVEAAILSFGGFDTHRDQGGANGQLAELLDRLGRSLETLMGALSSRLDRTTVVVLSEFGRRASENGSGGTDHGRGGLAMVMGGGINGGVHGDWPGLDGSSLVDGDVPVATDLRSVLAEVVANRLGNPALDVVFPGFDPVPLGIA